MLFVTAYLDYVIPTVNCSVILHLVHGGVAAVTGEKHMHFESNLTKQKEHVQD
jgi:hypothetical protein